MSDVIKLLPDSVANQIAAGEVIQRPASVIKELVENSIDANAKSISIVLKDAGRTLIQVIDDGDGMTDTDARLAFERHSTSKIRNAVDLFSLNTMGFRGEALASIAAISQMELRTSRKGSDLGTHIIIKASKCESQEADVCPVGCNFMVKNLFFNVPARRKFLKSNQVELSNVVKEFEKLALVNPSVDFTLVHNDNTMYQLSAGSFKQRILSLFGRGLDSQLIPLSLDTSLVKIKGFIGRPENARKRNSIQYLFVNGRYMRHPYFHKAIISSYGQLIPDDTQPNYFLNFTVDPETIDVNIHPTKTEIKFENEMPIWQILAAAVKESLGRFSAVPSIDFDTEGAPNIPVFHTNEKNLSSPQIELDPTYNPFESKHTMSKPMQTMHKESHPMDWEKLYNSFENTKQESLEMISQDEISKEQANKSASLNSKMKSLGENFHLEMSISDDSSICIQFKLKYIISLVKSGIMLVDQHRAHVKILYDRYIKQLSSSSIVSQSIMFPNILHLSSSQTLIVEEIADELEKMGFNISNLGGNDWCINGIPVGVEGIDVNNVLLSVIDSIIEGGDSISTRIFEHIAITIAEKAAIPYGRMLTVEEMNTLLGDLLRLPQPNYTPDGKTIINIMTLEQINKIFN